jgi:hypothetical protein
VANKVTTKDIENMNNLYLELKTYAAVARATGFSPATVKRYIVPDYQIITVVKSNLQPYDIERIIIPENLCDWLKLSKEEISEIKFFKREEVSL